MNELIVCGGAIGQILFLDSDSGVVVPFRLDILGRTKAEGVRLVDCQIVRRVQYIRSSTCCAEPHLSMTHVIEYKRHRERWKSRLCFRKTGLQVGAGFGPAKLLSLLASARDRRETVVLHHATFILEISILRDFRLSLRLMSLWKLWITQKTPLYLAMLVSGGEVVPMLLKQGRVEINTCKMMTSL